LNGPEKCNESTELVRAVPVTSMMKAFGVCCLLGLVYLLWQLINNPLIFCALIFGLFMVKLCKPQKKG